MPVLGWYQMKLALSPLSLASKMDAVHVRVSDCSGLSEERLRVIWGGLLTMTVEVLSLAVAPRLSTTLTVQPS